MKLKEKNKLFIIVLVAATLLLGLGIQLALGFWRQNKEAIAAAKAQLAYEQQLESERDAVQKSIARLVATQLELEREVFEAIELEREKRSLITLVNRWNSMEEGYVPELEDIGGQEQFDSRGAEALMQMIEDCKAAGNNPYICSAYRTWEMQQQLYDNKILRLIIDGTSEAEAPAIASRSVAIPGTSEHQLGLAVDIIDEFFPNLTAEQENTSTQQWLMANSWKYGFILRYPNGTTDITGIIYEPWHYRYVGPEYAAQIYELGVTLEEYLEQLYPVY